VAKVKPVKPIKEEKPKEAEVVQEAQPYAAVSDILAYAEEKSEGVTHRELSLAYVGIIKALKDVESWAKNIAEVEADIKAKKAKK